MKVGWTTAALGDVADIQRRGVDPTSIADDTAYLGLEHIESGGRIIGMSTIRESAVASTKFRFGPEHILFGKLRPYLAKIAAPDFPGVCSTDILPIRPKAQLDAGYLKHFLRQPVIVDLASARATGANLPRLSPSELARFELPLPPIEEQRRIATILDHVASVRDRSVEGLNRSNRLIEATFIRTFAASPKTQFTLGEIADVTSGITKGRRLPANTATENVPYLAVSNVKDRHLDLRVVKTIPVSERERERYRIRKGDLLITEGGDPDKLGRGTLWNDEIPEVLHQNHIFRVRLKDAGRVTPQYLSWFCASRSARAYFLRSAKQTTGISSINRSQLAALPVCVPNMVEQRRFGTLVDALTEIRGRLGARNDELDSLFAALQARAFSGRL